MPIFFAWLIEAHKSNLFFLRPTFLFIHAPIAHEGGIYSLTSFVIMPD